MKYHIQHPDRHSIIMGLKNISFQSENEKKIFNLILLESFVGYSHSIIKVHAEVIARIVESIATFGENETKKYITPLYEFYLEYVLKDKLAFIKQKNSVDTVHAFRKN